jgi:hypothetical protein
MRLSIPKIPTIQAGWRKCHLDNTAGIRYVNKSRRIPQDGCCLISGSIPIRMSPDTTRNFNFLLSPIQKGNFTIYVKALKTVPPALSFDVRKWIKNQRYFLSLTKRNNYLILLDNSLKRKTDGN